MALVAHQIQNLGTMPHIVCFSHKNTLPLTVNVIYIILVGVPTLPLTVNNIYRVSMISWVLLSDTWEPFF